jgi:hypothetical protein
MSNSYYSCRCTVRLCVLLWFALHLSFATQTHANIITVTNTNDSGPGSLRQAVADAFDGDTINFHLPANRHTITLTNGGLGIYNSVTISGPGADQLSIDGNRTGCVFGVARYNTVTISGLTVTNGDCGIYSDHAALTVSDCVVTANSYSGIYNRNELGPSSSVQRGNDRRDLKKIDGPSPGDVTIANTIVSDNSEHGVYNFEGHVTILNSTLSGNSAGQENSGGGIYTGGSKLPGSIMVINSTISGNFAFSGGGGISSYF